MRTTVNEISGCFHILQISVGEIVVAAVFCRLVKSRVVIIRVAVLTNVVGHQFRENSREVHADADSYARLDRQVKDYNLYYDYDLVVVGTRHAAHIKEHVPEWWGIITVEQVGDQVDFYMLREPQSNPQMDWNCKIEILWRPELAHIQELNAMHAYKQKSKRFVADKIVETVPKETLAVQLSEELFERDYTKIWETIQNFRKENGQKLRRRRRRRKTKKQA